MFLLAGTLVVTCVSSWLRRVILTSVGLGLLGLVPWPGPRRLLLGLLLDLAPGVVALALGALAGRLMVLKPIRAAAALVLAVWCLDLATTWLVTQDLRLWTDLWVLAGRLIVAAATAAGLALALGWRPRGKGKAGPPRSPEDAPAANGVDVGTGHPLESGSGNGSGNGSGSGPGPGNGDDEDDSR